MLKPGEEPIPGYRLEQFLGRGQFGEVWRTTAPGGGRAALKFLDLSGKQGWKEFRGIQRVKKIRHPHLMPITALWLLDEDWRIIDEAAVDRLSSLESKRLAQTLQVGSTDADDSVPRWLVVAQLLGDKTLGERLSECEAAGQVGIPADELLRYMEEAAKGIDFLNSTKHDLAHGRRSVQHCDIKPANILLLGDSVLICDYGVAQVLAEGDTSATATGMVGSPAYMAPECTEHKPSFASDQYSLAITYYELRTGELPFRSQSYFDVIEAHRKGKLDLNGLSPAERAVIRRATAVDPKSRFPTSQDMVRELGLAVHGDPTSGRLGSRQLVPLGLTLAAAVVGITLLVASFFPELFQRGQFTLHVSPPDAIVTIDGAQQTTDDGGFVRMRRPSASQILVKVSKPPEYLDVERSVDPKAQGDLPLDLELPIRPEYFLQRAQERVATRETDGAIADYARVFAMQADLARFPAPRVLLPANRAHSMKCLVTTPDRRAIVAGAIDGDLYRWDWTQNDLAATQTKITGEGRGIQSLALTNSRLIAADIGGTLIVRSLSDPNKIERKEQLLENIIEVAASSDDRWMVACSDGGQGAYLVEAWPLPSSGESAVKTKKVELGTHDKVVDEIRFVGDGQTVITGSWDGTVMAWPLSGSATDLSGTLAELEGDVYALAVSPRAIVVGGDGTRRDETLPENEANRHRLVIVPLSPKRGSAFALKEGHADAIEVVATTSDGNWIASGSVDTTIQVWQMDESGALQGPIVLSGGHTAMVTALQFDATGEWLISADDNGSLVLWDLRSSGQRGPFGLGRHSGAIVKMVVNSEATSLITAGADGAVLSWNLAQCRAIVRAATAAHVVPLAEPRTD